MKKTFFILVLMLCVCVGFAQKNVLVEELTGTWCQWCPSGIYYGDSLCHEYDNVIFVAIHCSDPMECSEYFEACGLTGAPSANIGRHFTDLTTQQWFSTVEAESQIAPKADLTVTYDFNPETRQLYATVVATALEDITGDYRLATLLVEDGVTGPAPSYNQSNSYSGGGHGIMGGYENLPNPIPAERIAYDHVGRALLCDYNGAPGSFPSSLQSGQQASHEFSCILEGAFDFNYVRVIGLLIAPDGTIDNAARSTYLNGNDNAAPLFTSNAKTEAYANLNYLYNVYFHDPDNRELTITLSQGPSWLTLEQYDGKSAVLYGIPAQAGGYEVSLTLSDGTLTTSQEFTIEVQEPLAGSWNYVGPRGFTPMDTQPFGIGMDGDGNLYVFGQQNHVPVLYKNAAGTDTWELMGDINTTCSVTAGGMVIASNGDVYVSYSENNNNDTGHVKKWDGSAWHEVGSPFRGVESHIYLDNDEVPYLLTRDVTQNYQGVVYRLEGQAWAPLTGTGQYFPSNEYGMHHDLAFDSDNTLYISYCDYTSSSSLKVTKFVQGEWVAVGGAIDNLYFNQRIAFDDNDVPYIAYCAYPSYQLRAVRFNGSEWESLGDNIAGGAISELSACFNDGKFTVAFVNDGQSNYLSVMEYDGSWSSVGPTLISEGPSDYPYMLIHDGAIYVAYTDDGLEGRASCLRYAENAVLYPPTDFTAEVFGNDNVSLSWNLPVEGSPTAYKLYRDDALVATVSELVYVDYNLVPGTHRYTLSAVYPEGESVQVGPVVVETTLSIGESASSGFSVYPTMVSDQVTIEIPCRETLSVYNTLGQRVMVVSLTEGANMVSVAILPAGMYYLRNFQGEVVKIVKK